jgi:hypothetical protein
VGSRIASPPAHSQLSISLRFSGAVEIRNLR